ncbi:MAG: DUF362 domain-containing protein, partial [Candidatus Bipolaricaulia bacterium]
MARPKNPVAFLKTDDRKYGVEQSLRTLKINPVKGKDVLIKPNFNTADHTPGSTHNDTLVALVEAMWDRGARSVTVGERSYPSTLEVMEKKGILPLMERLGARVLNFDDLPARDWVAFRGRNGYWTNGFRIARPILDAECLVSTCCLKTHQFGG